MANAGAAAEADHEEAVKATTSTTKEIKQARSPKNSSQGAKTEKPSPEKAKDDGEDEEHAKVPAVDVTLDETRRILSDYLLLLANGKNVAVIKSDAKPALR